ncbi:MAG: hypothetical protein HY791_38745 [Deltaproteobacteria bacterium]|nr:hypothetical protein [Deltaproteobacteria bacterium]
MSDSKVLDLVLLLALPASGKSEVRRYLRHVSAEERKSHFHIGPTLQLDDFPYVHLMRVIDDVLHKMAKPRLYFDAPERSFQDGRDWGTLIELINEDFTDLQLRREVEAPSSAYLSMDRLEAAALSVGIGPRLAALDPITRAALASAIEHEAKGVLGEKAAAPVTLEGQTIIAEFARGGAEGSPVPIAGPYGYQYSLSHLSPAILERASILYIWVTPEESRRKNAARADPNDPGSILHHSVPEYVMRKDYGVDDMDWLESSSEKAGCVTVKAHGRKFHLPIARFDNRVDRTSFLRDDPEKWAPAAVSAVHESLRMAFERLASSRG